MRVKSLICAAVAALCVVFAAPAAAVTPATSLTGAGSLLISPLVAAWGGGFNALFGVTVAFNPIGSPTAITELGSGTVNFGASESPLAALAHCSGCLQVPWAVSGLAVGYNVPQAGTQLRLTGTVLAEIYLGQITNWNDSRIAALNPGVKLPNLAITPLGAAGSSETYVFSDFLSKVSPTWRHRIGVGNTVSFPAGLTRPTATAVSAALVTTKGAIGYVSPAFLFTHSLPAAAIANAAGAYTYPNLSNIQAAAATVKAVPASGALDIVYPAASARAAYPLSTFSYIDVSPRASAPVKATLKELILYAIGLGRQYGPALDFAKLPSPVVTFDKAAVQRFAG